MNQSFTAGHCGAGRAQSEFASIIHFCASLLLSAYSIGENPTLRSRGCALVLPIEEEMLLPCWIRPVASLSVWAGWLNTLRRSREAAHPEVRAMGPLADWWVEFQDLPLDSLPGGSA